MFKDAFFIFVNRFFVSLSLILGTYLLAHHIPVQQYGQYQNFWTQFNTLFAISGLGLSAFLFSYSAEKIITIIKTTSLKHIAGLGTVVLATALIFGYIQTKNEIPVLLAAFFLVANTLVILSDSFLSLLKRHKTLSLSNFLYFIFFVGIHYWAISQANFELEKTILALTILTLIKLLINAIVLSKCFQNNGENTLIDKNHRVLWRHLYLFDIVQILFLYADKFIISIMAPATLSAVYINGTYPIPFVAIIFSAVSSASLMQMKSNGTSLDTWPEVLKKSASILGTVVIPIFCFFWIFSTEFISAYFSETYLDAVPIFQMTLLALPFKAFNFTILLQAKEKGSIINMGMLIDIIVLLSVSYPLYYYLGLKGIPLALAIGTLAQAAFYLYHHQKILNKSVLHFLPLKNWCINLIFFMALCLALKYFTQNVLDFSHWPQLVFSVAIVGLIVIAQLVKLIKSKDKIQEQACAE